MIFYLIVGDLASAKPALDAANNAVNCLDKVSDVSHRAVFRVMRITLRYSLSKGYLSKNNLVSNERTLI